MTRRAYPSDVTDYGPDVDVAAPGASVHSTALGGGYAPRSGTSLAAPHVSGLAALLFSLPGQVTAGQVRAAIESTTLDVDDPGPDPRTGAGLIQMDAAMQAVPSLSAPSDQIEMLDFDRWRGQVPPWK